MIIRIHRNILLAINDVSTTDDAIWAGEQVRPNVKKEKKERLRKSTPRVTTSPI